MRVPTVIATLVVLVGLVGVAAFALAGGGAPDADLTAHWTSDTARSSPVNHHVPAAGFVDGRGMVYAPLSGQSNSNECALVGLNGTDGSEVWTYPVPRANCTIHAVANPTVADYDGDGVSEVFVATTERAVLGLDPATGEVEFRHELSAYGYSRPLVTDLTGDGRREVVVVDVKGAVYVLDADGSERWVRNLSSYTFGQPAVADFDADGERELFVATGGSGGLVLYEADGTVAWERNATFDGGVTWSTAGQADDDAAVEVAVATSRGVVAVLDGRDGAVQWRRDLGTLAAVHAMGDGDGDGEVELYAVAADAVLRSFTASDGTDEWRTTLTTERVQMTPPPSLGDVDGDGRQELVAVTNDGVVSVVDPATGSVLATDRREGPIWTNPRLADVTGDGVPETFVVYGDGRVVSYRFTR